MVLLDQDRHPIGQAPREGIHSQETPFHLAFSCWLVDESGQLLMTRRALGKRSWPGVWTNSFCGHPRPTESLVEAVARHGRVELGVDVADITALLPDFAYRAVDAGGTVENEYCPVFLARVPGPVVPHPDEVVEHHWLGLAQLRAALDAAPWALSPWLAAQAAELDEAGRWTEVEAFSARAASRRGASTDTAEVR
ncbi:isopentenyl-diphosphate Delta-isomerase [Nocardioides gilvus]|uniref:isopentenyl-diphosphate Delta-isomerase n=1 Tax=Nocardioides gilvus TaxID=1735589 RepID=UPI003B82FC0F